VEILGKILVAMAIGGHGCFVLWFVVPVRGWWWLEKEASYCLNQLRRKSTAKNASFIVL